MNFYKKKLIFIMVILTILVKGLCTFAAIVSDNDGSAFVSKAEFEAMKSNFEDQIINYEDAISTKIDGAIASYLAGIKLTQKIILENDYVNNGGNNLQWKIIDVYKALDNNGIYGWNSTFKRPYFFCQWYTGAGTNYTYSTECTGNGAGARVSNYHNESDMNYNIIWDCNISNNKKELLQLSLSGIRASAFFHSANIKTWTRTDNLFKLSSDGTTFVNPTLTGATYGVGDSEVIGILNWQLYRKKTVNLKNVNMIKLLFNGSNKALSDNNIRAHDLTKDGVATNNSSATAVSKAGVNAPTTVNAFNVYEQNEVVKVEDLYSSGQVSIDNYGKVGNGRLLTTPSASGTLSFKIKKTAGTYNFWKFAIYDESNLKQSLGTIEDGLEFICDNAENKIKSKVFTDANSHSIKLDVKKNSRLFIKLYPCTNSAGTLATTHNDYVKCSVEGDIVLEIE